MCIPGSSSSRGELGEQSEHNEMFSPVVLGIQILPTSYCGQREERPKEEIQAFSPLQGRGAEGPGLAKGTT